MSRAHELAGEPVSRAHELAGEPVSRAHGLTSGPVSPPIYIGPRSPLDRVVFTIAILCGTTFSIAIQSFAHLSLLSDNSAIPLRTNLAYFFSDLTPVIELGERNT